jgi:primosomal protein N' (replication factor Y)
VVVAARQRQPGERYKVVQALLDNKPVLTQPQLALARWISEEYMAPLGRTCALMVPPGFTPKSSTLLALRDAGPLGSNPRELLDAGQRRIVEMLRARGPMLEQKLRRVGGDAKTAAVAIDALLKRGWLTQVPTLLPPKAQPQRSTLAQLTLSDQTLELALNDLLNPREATRIQLPTRERRAAVLRYLRDRNGLAWADWIVAETGATRPDLSWLAENGYVLLGDAERWRDPLADTDYVVKTAPPLTEDQQRAWDVVRSGMTQPDSPLHDAPGTPKLRHAAFLMRGVTGSGKTEVYMRAVDLALRAGRGAIVLVPEISLTPQTSRRFLERFPGKVALIHSKLRPGERYDTWRRIRAGELPIVVGARSGLFAPLPNLGLIVLDEEHDSSFKQNAAPFYDARRAAMRYARAQHAAIIFGSATPSLEALAQALDPNHPEHLTLLELPNRVRAHAQRIEDQAVRLHVKPAPQRETNAVAYQPLPEVEVIDMRAELRGGNTSMFSGALFQALTQTLQRREQAILFLNRRGAASSVICRDCGYAHRCPNDDTPLTLHRSDSDADKGIPISTTLRCHTCEHHEAAPTRCPACGSSRIRFLGIGTQTIEDELHKRFPAARVVRWDKDTAGARGAADQMLKRFQNQQADVLIGTQMIAKGLDLPLVTLVGVVLSDVGLFLPDFRASERVFNLLEQVAGRAGRALLPGRVIVQTYNPDHPAVAFAAKHDVKGFARHELALRQALALPPQVRLVKFECAELDAADARKKCEAVARQLRERVSDESAIIGPASCFFERRARRYRWQLLARTHDPAALLKDLPLPSGMLVDVDPATVL